MMWTLFRSCELRVGNSVELALYLYNVCIYIYTNDIICICIYMHIKTYIYIYTLVTSDRCSTPWVIPRCARLDRFFLTGTA